MWQAMLLRNITPNRLVLSVNSRVLIVTHLIILLGNVFCLDCPSSA